MVCKRILKVLGGIKVSKGPRLAKGTYRSEVGNRNLKVQGWPKVSKGLSLAKVT